MREWYTAEEMMEKYDMTQNAVYSFVWSNNIPKKKVKKQTFYSKLHVDNIKNKDSSSQREPSQLEPQYYTIKEACAKFGVSRDMLYKFGLKNNLPKVQEGRCVKYEKAPLDRFFKEYFAPPQL